MVSQRQIINGRRDNLVLLYLILIAVIALFLYVILQFKLVIDDKKLPFVEKRNWIFYVIAASVFLIAAVYQIKLFTSRNPADVEFSGFVHIIE